MVIGAIVMIFLFKNKNAKSVTLDEIIDFDGFRVICNAVAICLYGMDAVKIAEKKIRFKKKRKVQVRAYERS